MPGRPVIKLSGQILAIWVAPRNHVPKDTDELVMLN